jgi:hypothetical protein
MFNLLVSDNGEWWETPPRSIMVSRFKEYSGAEAEEIDLARPETLRLLEGVPTLLMYEVGAGGPHARVVRHGGCGISFVVAAISSLRSSPIPSARIFIVPSSSASPINWVWNSLKGIVRIGRSRTGISHRRSSKPALPRGYNARSRWSHPNMSRHVARVSGARPKRSKRSWSSFPLRCRKPCHCYRRG